MSAYRGHVPPRPLPAPAPAPHTADCAAFAATPAAAPSQPARHTPGPWHWNGNTLLPVAGDFATSDVHSILDADGGYGYLGSKLSDTLAELDADRRLIAAAPDLLDALQVVVADWTAQRERNGHLAPAWCRQARAAIAKATGADA